MSMFIVSYSDMNRCVRGFQILWESSPVYWNRKLIPFTDVSIMDSIVDWTTLGRRLFEMNLESAVQRYGENHGMDNGSESLFEYKKPLNTPLDCLKAMQSLRYQCSEGDVDETALYKFLELGIGALAERICRSLPEYDKAAW